MRGEHATSLWAKRSPHKNWHGQLPLPFGERVGVRGEHATSLWAKRSSHKNWHGRPPLPFGERVRVRGNMRLRWAEGSTQKWARSAPSPLWGEGWGEGKHAISQWERATAHIVATGDTPIIAAPGQSTRQTAGSSSCARSYAASPDDAR